MIGDTIGSYRITAKIGAGGMGEVYRATDTRLGREMAIKFSTEQFSDRFEREARAVAALNHPNICTLYDVGPNYLVMELVEGPTLAERIVEGAIPLGEALGLARQIAAGLAEAHEKGITHRDLRWQAFRGADAGRHARQTECAEPRRLPAELLGRSAAARRDPAMSGEQVAEDAGNLNAEFKM